MKKIKLRYFFVLLFAACVCGQTFATNMFNVISSNDVLTPGINLTSNQGTLRDAITWANLPGQSGSIIISISTPNIIMLQSDLPVIVLANGVQLTINAYPAFPGIKAWPPLNRLLLQNPSAPLITCAFKIANGTGNPSAKVTLQNIKFQEWNDAFLHLAIGSVPSPAFCTCVLAYESTVEIKNCQFLGFVNGVSYDTKCNMNIHDNYFQFYFNNPVKRYDDIPGVPLFGYPPYDPYTQTNYTGPYPQGFITTAYGGGGIAAISMVFESLPSSFQGVTSTDPIYNTFIINNIIESRDQLPQNGVAISIDPIPNNNNISVPTGYFYYSQHYDVRQNIEISDNQIFSLDYGIYQGTAPPLRNDNHPDGTYHFKVFHNIINSNLINMTLSAPYKHFIVDQNTFSVNTSVSCTWISRPMFLRLGSDEIAYTNHHPDLEYKNFFGFHMTVNPAMNNNNIFQDLPASLSLHPSIVAIGNFGPADIPVASSTSPGQSAAAQSETGVVFEDMTIPASIQVNAGKIRVVPGSTWAPRSFAAV